MLPSFGKEKDVEVYIETVRPGSAFSEDDWVSHRLIAFRNRHSTNILVSTHANGSILCVQGLNPMAGGFFHATCKSNAGFSMQYNISGTTVPETDRLESAIALLPRNNS